MWGALWFPAIFRPHLEPATLLSEISQPVPTTDRVRAVAAIVSGMDRLIARGLSKVWYFMMFAVTRNVPGSAAAERSSASLQSTIPSA
jgi:hypothetical protein